MTENPAIAESARAIGPARWHSRRRGREPTTTATEGGIIQTIEVERATQIAEELGLRRKGAAKRKSKRRNGKSCEDCFFHRRLLCALDLDEPCSTFRPEGPHGLVPPRQPALLMRDN